MLRDRLSAAADYLKAHPASNCVVSGGQGADENQSEASVMKAFLLTQGIAPERIREEGRSVNTSENLRFSAAIIEREGWSRRTVDVYKRQSMISPCTKSAFRVAI